MINFWSEETNYIKMDRIFEAADKGGALWVIDDDIKDYFGSISHDKLLLMVEHRITDRKVLKLIKGWLKAGVLEAGQYSESTLGAPQGGLYRRFYPTYI